MLYFIKEDIVLRHGISQTVAVLEILPFLDINVIMRI